MKANRPRVSSPFLVLCFFALAGCDGVVSPRKSKVEWDSPANWSRNDHLSTVAYEAEPVNRVWQFENRKTFQGRQCKYGSLYFTIRNTTGVKGGADEGRDVRDLKIVASVVDDRGRVIVDGAEAHLRYPPGWAEKYAASDAPLPLFPPGETAEAYFAFGEIPEDSKRILIRITSPKTAGWRPIYWTQGVPANRPAS